MTDESIGSPGIGDAEALRLEGWLRVGLSILLVPLAWHAFHSEYGRVPLLGDVDLAIHEFGHALFRPFGIPFAGHTMVILGGSLFQIAFPLIFVGYFLARERDRKRDVHAAMVCLWWAGLNMLDVSVYMADSRAGKLMLLSGVTGSEGGDHDWRELLAGWGVLQHDTLYAARLRALAVLVVGASIVIGILAAWPGRGVTPISKQRHLAATR